MCRPSFMSIMVAGLLVAGCRPAAGDPRPARPQTVADVAPTARAVNTFACDLYGKLRGQDGNLFLSPYSISAALTMTYAGANGPTADEMARVLHLGGHPDTAHTGQAALMRQLLGRPDAGYELHVANALWVQKDFALLQTFLDTMNTHYGAGAKSADFAGATEQTRQTINAWVEDHTKDKIQELLKPGVLDTLTRLVLTNAIYFKGTWASQFKEDATKPAPFHASPNATVDTPMMSQTHEFGYLEDKSLQVLEMPYTGGDLSMVVLLPKAQDGLPALERSLTAERASQWVDSLRPRNIQVYLPRFKTTAEFELNDVLTQLGMRLAFDNSSADFSGMTGNRDLYISAVVHKAFVDVNEEGTEAAAATAAVVRTKAMPMRPPVFRADHPYLFLIRDTRSGAILFMGRVADPTQSPG
jgi:serine protease inhibitor